MLVEDAELLRRYLEERSEAAFTELVGRHVDLVYHAALRKLNGDSHRAQDVTQSVFSLLAQQAGSLHRHEALAGWLHTTTRYAANRIIRTEQRRKTREMEASLMHELSNESAPEAWERLGPVVDDVLGELNAADRSAVLLRFFSARSLAEVGAALGLSENAARMRIDRALDKLRSRLARRGITSTAAALGFVLANHPAIATPPTLAANVAHAALGSAVSVATPVSGVLQFMSTTKFVAGAAVLTLSLVIGVSVAELHGSKDAGRALDVARMNGLALKSRLEEVERRGQEAADSLGAMKRAIADLRAARATEENQMAEAAARARDPMVVGQEFLAAHPEALALATDYTRVRMKLDYQLLFESLGLTPEQIERFTDLRMRTEGLSWSTSRQAPAAQFNFSETPREDVERGLKELLGDAGYRQYQEFDRSRGARVMVEGLARRMSASDEPLSTAQAQQMIEIITRNNPGYREGHPFSMGKFDWTAATSEAGSVLSARQLAAFAESKSPIDEPFRQAMNQAVRDAMNQAARAAGAPLNY